MDDMDNIIEVLCNRFRCSFGTPVLENVRHAHDILIKLQHKDMFDQMLDPKNSTHKTHGPTAMRLSLEINTYSQMHGECLSSSSESCTEPDYCGEEEEEGFYYNEPCVGSLEDLKVTSASDCWQGHFKGYEILNDSNSVILNEHKKCVEMTRNDSDSDIISYLRSGVRCFIIDFFAGMEYEFQTLIVRLRENELRLAQEIGYPVISTLIAKLSPRLQYTGLLQPENSTVELKAQDKIILTANRYWSTRCNERRIYVNARFLLGDLHVCDFILIGPKIQVRVLSVEAPDHVHCVVEEGGILKSRLPVLFPARCRKTRLSLEEIVDITFAREVGINIIVSYISGTEEYHAHLQDVVQLLKCKGMRLWARVVLNELHGIDHSLDWIANKYDGFLIEFNADDSLCEECVDKIKKSETDETKSEPQGSILQLCPAAENFLTRAYKQQKPIHMEIKNMAKHKLLVAPENYKHIFYYPDKYVVRCRNVRDSPHFDYLQTALFEKLAQSQLSPLAHCDMSCTGSNSLARACVAAAYESNAAVIIVCGHTGRMATKISHYRPKIPIVFISSMQSAGDFVSAYHHVIMLQIYHDASVEKEEPYCFVRFKCLVLGLTYAKSCKLLQDGDRVILVYGQKERHKCPDRYVVYKFIEKHFVNHMKRIVFDA